MSPPALRLHPHIHPPLHPYSRLYIALHCSSTLRPTAHSAIGASFRLVLILHLHNSYSHCYTNTAAAPLNKHTHTQPLHAHHGAYTISASSPAHSTRTTSWRQLRAILTASVEPSGRPTRHSPSPRATHPTGQARRDSHGHEQVLVCPRKRLHPLTALVTSTSPLSTLYSSRALECQPARLGLGLCCTLVKPAPPVNNNGWRHAANSGQDASQAPGRRYELDCTRLVSH